MKKVNIISTIAILVGFIGLGLLKKIGLTAHIIISIVTLAIMLVCMIIGKKDWKVPLLEILYRVFYLGALVAGFIMTKGNYAAVLAIIHKVVATIFALLFIVSSVINLKSK